MGRERTGIGFNCFCAQVSKAAMSEEAAYVVEELQEILIGAAYFYVFTK